MEWYGSRGRVKWGELGAFWKSCRVETSEVRTVKAAEVSNVGLRIVWQLCMGGIEVCMKWTGSWGRIS